MDRKGKPVERQGRKATGLNPDLWGKMSEEHIEIRFGIIAFEKGFVTEKQIIKALKLQVKESLVEEKRRLFGEILVSLGYMTNGEVIEVMKNMVGDLRTET